MGMAATGYLLPITGKTYKQLSTGILHKIESVNAKMNTVIVRSIHHDIRAFKLDNFNENFSRI